MSIQLTERFREVREQFDRAANDTERLECLHAMREEIDACINHANGEVQAFTVPPLVELANKTFFRDLPQLLQEHPKKWVAYHGDKRVGIAKSSSVLYRECRQASIPEDEFVVRCIEPHGDLLGSQAVGFLGGLYHDLGPVGELKR